MSPERFADLVRAEQTSLRRFLLGLCCGNAPEADDIAQEALVRAWVASGSFLGRSRFSTWLFRIAYRCYIDRKRKFRPESLSADAVQARKIPDDAQADDAFRWQRLYAALDALPEKEKAATVLHYFEECSIREIAAILQTPAGTVKYLLFSARKRLKTLLQ